MRVTRRAALTAAAACALLGGALWMAVRREPAPAGAAKGNEPAAACACDGAAGTAQAAPPPVPASAPTEAGPSAVVRFAVCEREETRAALAQVALVPGRPALWALHCGRSVHLIAVEAFEGALVPRRVAVVQAASPSPAEAAVALEPSAADVDGDGRADWITPVTFVDAAGVPRGGGVYVLHQRAEGGLEAPRRLLAAAPGRVVSAQFDGDPGEDLAVLHRADASTGRADELWLMTGGPSPLRVAQRPAGVGTSAIAALDLDADRRDDLAAASRSEGRVLFWLSSGGALAQVAPTELKLPGVEQLLAADLDGDGTRELVLGGERWFWLSGPVSPPPSPVPAPIQIDGSEGLRDVHLADTDRDGRPELVGYVHPEVIALRSAPKRRFERARVLSLRGEASVLFARIAQLDGDARPDLVVVVLASSGRDVEIGVAPNVEPAAIVQLSARTAPIADAALVQRFTLL